MKTSERLDVAAIVCFASALFWFGPFLSVAIISGDPSGVRWGAVAIPIALVALALLLIAMGVEELEHRRKQ